MTTFLSYCFRYEYFAIALGVSTTTLKEYKGHSSNLDSIDFAFVPGDPLQVFHLSEQEEERTEKGRAIAITKAGIMPLQVPKKIE